MLDALWEEDHTRSRNWNLDASLAIMGVALISVRFRLGLTRPWPDIFEQCGQSTVPAASLIKGISLK